MPDTPTASVDRQDLAPLRPHLFVRDGTGRVEGLLGCRCEICGARYFPARKWCATCFTDGCLVDWPLPARGIVHASTVARVRSAVGHAPPHAYGYVTLGDGESGIRIFAPFAGDTPESFVPGRTVRLDFGAIPAAGVPATLGYSAQPDRRPSDE